MWNFGFKFCGLVLGQLLYPAHIGHEITRLGGVAMVSLQRWAKNKAAWQEALPLCPHNSDLGSWLFSRSTLMAHVDWVAKLAFCKGGLRSMGRQPWLPNETSWSNSGNTMSAKLTAKPLLS